MLADYVNWFNNFRIYSTLGYFSPKDYKLHNLKKLSNLVLIIQLEKEKIFQNMPYNDIIDVKMR